MPRITIAVLVAALSLAGCSSKRPVLYPNDAYYAMGEHQADEVVDDCLERARAADVADTRTESAAKKGTGGAIAGGIVGGLIGLVFGRAGRGAAAGAAGGGSSSAIEGAARGGESSPNFRRWVETCVREQGLQPIGWK